MVATQYLGPARGVVSFSTWEEVVDLASGGLFEESQWCELKEMPTPIGQGKKNANVEMACDLASLSVFGGLLIYGITDSFEVRGCDISGLVDRISNVAGSRVHPPLSPIIHPAIENPDDSTKHVLVVQVPPSPLAPHMVDGSYWGRSSHGKDKLSDELVRMLMASRKSSVEAFADRLQGLIDNDPLDDLVIESTGQGRLYLLAEPCAPVIGAALDSRELHEVAQEAASFDDRSTLADFNGLRIAVPDPLGPAWCSDKEPVEKRYERDLIRLMVHTDDWAVEMVTGSATAQYDPYGRGEQNHLLGATVVRQTRQFLRLVRLLGLRWSYMGPWRIGLHMEPLKGSFWASSSWDYRETGFARDHFRFIGSEEPSSWDEGATEPTMRLLAGLLRGVDRQDWTFDDLISRG